MTEVVVAVDVPKHDHRPPLVALWNTPAWATETITDGEYVEYRHTVGSIHPKDGDWPFAVEVVQRYEITLAPGSAGVMQSDAVVSLAGERLDPEQARRLAEMLVTAVNVAEPDNAATSPSAQLR